MSMVTLHCQAGDHIWERQSQRGWKPHCCPEHLGAEAEARDEGEATATTTTAISATERVDRLEMMLKSRGTHLSQVG